MNIGLHTRPGLSGGLLDASGTVKGVESATYDGNGTASGLVHTADGTSLALYQYGPFGELIRMTGPMAKANPFRFSTEYYDDETDIIMFPYRPYSPSSGRFLTRDPIGEPGASLLYGFGGPGADSSEGIASSEEISGPNLSCFVQNNPVNSFDALGLVDYRFIPVVGELGGGLPVGAGRWGQPLTYADGSASATLTSAYTYENVWSGPTSGGSCNTVWFRGAKGDAGSIIVFARDKCGGRYRMFFSLTYDILTTGPRGNANLKVINADGRTIFEKRFVARAVHFKKTEMLVTEADLPASGFLSGEGKQVLFYDLTIAFGPESVYKNSTSSVTTELKAGPVTKVN